MAYEGSVCAASSSASSLQIEEAKVVSSKDVKSKKKWYSAERNATRIYLYEQFNRWRDLKEELSLKMDKELAAVLLDNYANQKGCCFSS